MANENTQNDKLTYYQFQKDLNYSIFIKIEDENLTDSIKEQVETLGFSKIESKEFKEIKLKKFETRILKISKASFKVARQIMNAFSGMEKYGNESISPHGSYEVYRYRNVGMMVLSQSNPEWELGLVNLDGNNDGLKVMLSRYLTWSLESYGVLAFWAVPVDEGIVVMNMRDAKAETVFLDLNSEMMLTQDGNKKLPSYLQVLRLDSTLRGESRVMGKEELLSFLTTNTAYFSYKGLPKSLRSTLMHLVQFSQGLVYPQENFEPRNEAA